MQYTHNTRSVSIYDREEVQFELARQRDLLRKRGLSGRARIGIAHIPRPASVPGDQRWVQELLLGKQ